MNCHCRSILFILAMATPESSLSCFRYFLFSFPCSLLLLLPFMQLAAAVDPLADPRITSDSQPDFCCPSVPAEIASTFKVLVPNRTFSKEFVDCSDSYDVKGFSIDVFEAVWSLLHPNQSFTNVSYTCFSFHTGASYSDMVNCLSHGSFDAVVGDVTISAERLKSASSTLPYMNSGVVLLAPMVEQTRRFPGLLFQPFTAQMWCTIWACALITGFVLWLLEHNMHPEFRNGQQKLQIQKVLWFIASLLIFFQRYTIQNPLTKAALACWLGFVLVLSSAYIATLSVILTVHELRPQNLTISTLQSGNFKVGYQTNSLVKDYLTQRLHIPDKRLVGLSSRNAFADALSKGPFQTGGVAAIVEEVPYVNLFLSGLPSSSCSYGIVGSKRTNEGLGFMFPTDSTNLSTEFSKAILHLSENGHLQKLQTNAKLSNYKCPAIVQSARLNLMTSQGSFLFLGLVCIGVLAKLTAQGLENRNTPLRKMPSTEPRGSVHRHGALPLETWVPNSLRE